MKVKGHSRLGGHTRYFQASKLLLLEGIKAGDGYASDVRLGVEVLRLSGIIRPAFTILTYGIHIAITSQEGVHD